VRQSPFAGDDEKGKTVADDQETLEDEPTRPAGPETPFDSIEGAHEYVGLLADAIAEAEAAIQEDIVLMQGQGAPRRIQALHVVAFKLEKLRNHITSSRRILNDLRSLRRLLLEERQARSRRNG
jgi:hypothetical protein